MVLLDRVRTLDQKSPTEKAKSIRKQFEGRDFGNTVNEIREDRER